MNGGGTLFQPHAQKFLKLDFRVPGGQARHAFALGVQFGWASGALATTLMTDYGQPADEEQVWTIWEGNARVKR